MSNKGILNGYNVFCETQMSAMKLEFPDATPGLINRMLGRKWRALSDEESPFEKEAIIRSLSFVVDPKVRSQLFDQFARSTRDLMLNYRRRIGLSAVFLMKLDDTNETRIGYYFRLV
jgi:hypothetical protein